MDAVAVSLAEGLVEEFVIGGNVVCVTDAAEVGAVFDDTEVDMAALAEAASVAEVEGTATAVVMSVSSPKVKD